MYNTTLHTMDQTDYTLITENFQADWNILPELKLSGRFSLQSQHNGSDQFKPADATDFATVPDSLFNTRGQYVQGYGKALSYQGDLYLNYSRTMGKNVLFATLAHTYSRTGTTIR